MATRRGPCAAGNSIDGSASSRTLRSPISFTPPSCRIAVKSASGTLSELSDSDKFDTILYMDVFEHIEDDRAELERAAAQLAPDGHLIVLAPAHQWLFTPFDESIGHYRRYSRRTLEAPPRAVSRS